MAVREVYERTTTREVSPDEIAAAAFSCADPFDVVDPCPFNPTGHHFIADCSEVVCIHCARIAWQ